MARTKKYLKVKKDAVAKVNSAEEAVKQVKKNSISKFDGSVDLHVVLKKGKKKGEDSQPVRATLTLPHSLGGETRVVVFAEGSNVAAAKKAGAIESDAEVLAKKIEEGWMDFDVAIAEPQVMPKIAKLGPKLGPKGIMPNPKTGTVTDDVVKAVEEFLKGKLSIREDETGIMHVKIGKVSMDDKQLVENYEATLKAIVEATGKSSKELAVNRVYLAPTMGPSVEIEG